MHPGIWFAKYFKVQSFLIFFLFLEASIMCLLDLTIALACLSKIDESERFM